MPDHPRYLLPYTHMQLNQVVIPGTHDAGIYLGNKKNGVTQSLSIGGQARAGVRFFDIRVGAQRVVDQNNNATYEMRAFHLDGSLKKQSKIDNPTGNITTHMQGKIGPKTVDFAKVGAWGGGLQTMLTEARDFVIANPSEFLILKISKSTNYLEILKLCKTVLGGYWHCPASNFPNLNEATVASVAGRVITLFSNIELEKEGITRGNKIWGKNGEILSSAESMGILYFGELYKDGVCKSYSTNFAGLQYFGKFGASTFTRTTAGKYKKNTKAQEKNMKIASVGKTEKKWSWRKARRITTTGGHCDPRVMGMMYWTSTGVFESIQDRDREMWRGPLLGTFKRVWNSGLYDSFQAQIGRGGITANFKSFIPNIVMMDFADGERCAIVDDLNRATNEMMEMALDMWEILGDG